MEQTTEQTVQPKTIGVWPDDYIENDEDGNYVSGPHSEDFEDFCHRLSESLPKDLKKSGTFEIRWVNRTWRGLVGNAVDDMDKHSISKPKNDVTRIHTLLGLITPNSEYTLTALKPESSKEFYHLKFIISHHDVPTGEKWFIKKVKPQEE
jgi:hypothetical protein